MEANRSGPDASDSHFMPSFSLKIHIQALGQDTHPHLSHGVCCLAPKKSRVDRRTNDDDTTFPTVPLEMRQNRLDCSIQAFGIDALHKLESFHGRILHRRPPDCSRIVDNDIDSTINLPLSDISQRTPMITRL
jgi:hypothetical protein